MCAVADGADEAGERTSVAAAFGEGGGFGVRVKGAVWTRIMAAT